MLEFVRARHLHLFPSTFTFIQRPKPKPYGRHLRSKKDNRNNSKNPGTATFLHETQSRANSTNRATSTVYRMVPSLACRSSPRQRRYLGWKQHVSTEEPNKPWQTTYEWPIGLCSSRWLSSGALFPGQTDRIIATLTPCSYISNPENFRGKTTTFLWPEMQPPQEKSNSFPKFLFSGAQCYFHDAPYHLLSSFLK